MPFKDPDPTDPNMLVGVVLPADAEATRDMAYVFAEEFARLGYSREQLLWLFKNPFYGGAHGAYRSLGEKETLAIVDECIGAWGNFRVSVQDVQTVQAVSEVSNDATSESIRSTIKTVTYVPGTFVTLVSGPHSGGGLRRGLERTERLERLERERREEREKWLKFTTGRSGGR